MEEYDVVIVGSGVVGALLAGELTKAGHRVLVLECGEGVGQDWHSSGDEHEWRRFWRRHWGLYESWIGHFERADAKTPNSAYPDNPNAPQPSVLSLRDGYYHQTGPLTFGSNYNRSPGGTTLHWLGTCLRMLPNDFHTQTEFGRGVDWPMTYDDLLPDYGRAEAALGVSADVEDQVFLTEHFGLKFEPGYVYPMHRIPQSYLDRYLSERVDGSRIDVGNESFPVEVVSTPQARNSMPNAAYDDGKGYRPVGAAGYPELGQRCNGNSSCIPICPIQAKFNALKSLATSRFDRLDFRTQAVVTDLTVDPESGRISEVHYKRYQSTTSQVHEDITVTGKVVVLAANAIENAKLLLAAGVANSSDQVGRNLMDHPVALHWATLPDPIGSFRGPGSTSGIPTLRDGMFRRDRAAFRIEIGNRGWSWPQGSPYSDVEKLVDEGAVFSGNLRKQIYEQTSRQFYLSFLVEQLPDATNRVSIDPAIRDALGVYRPVINWGLSDYSRAGFEAATEASKKLFAALDAKDATTVSSKGQNFFEYRGGKYEAFGASHLAGTHLMGSDSGTSVVDSHQRSWDHENLYIAGCGSMPNMGTSNPTLTLAALTFRSARRILQDLAS
jgi:choline dehydrogenase-like flavoprotein